MGLAYLRNKAVSMTGTEWGGREYKGIKRGNGESDYVKFCQMRKHKMFLSKKAMWCLLLIKLFIWE